MDLNKARRLYRLAEESINRLDTALFIADHADDLERNKEEEQENVFKIITNVGDYLGAFASFDTSAGLLLNESVTALDATKKEPFKIVEFPPKEGEDSTTEEFFHPIVLRNLLGRISKIYALDPDQLKDGLTVAQGHLLTICRNAAASINLMIAKNLISVPQGEHNVKHLLFAIARASFTDAVPDGQISFTGQFQNHKPDFGIPRLKCCVETKVARDRTSMSSAIDGIIADQSNYGSEDFNTFIAVIYTDNNSITQEDLDTEIRNREEKSGNTKYMWQWVLINGPLQSSKTRKK